MKIRFFVFLLFSLIIQIESLATTTEYVQPYPKYYGIETYNGSPDVFDTPAEALAQMQKRWCTGYLNCTATKATIRTTRTNGRMVSAKSLVVLSRLFHWAISTMATKDERI